MMRIGPQRPVNPDAIVAPQGYRVEALITGLTFPSAISFGPGGELYLAEGGGVAGSRVATPRVLRIDPDRSVNEIGRLENPIVGLVYRNGELLIGEDGSSPRILRVTAEGDLQVLVDGLPGGGDYGLSGLALDNSGALLFGLGTRTNSGVVGLDNLARGWAARNPEWADVAGADVKLTEANYVTTQSNLRGSYRSVTGPFKPFRARSDAGETVRGSALCGGAVYRLAADGGEPERLAWGLRNPAGIACSPDGRVLASEGGMEERGSRPIAAAPDNLWEVRPGSYYGWPDHASGIPITDPRFRLPGLAQPRRLLDNAPKVSGTPIATFAPRSGVGRLDFSTSEEFGLVGEVLVALSGEWCSPAYVSDAPSPGFRVVRVDPRSGAVSDFLVNRQAAPSSNGNSGGLERPFDVRFDPSGEVLYVVDLGEAHVSREFGLEPFGGTGIVWRITRVRTTARVPELPRKQASEPEDEAPAVFDAEDEAGEAASEPDDDAAAAGEEPTEAAPDADETEGAPAEAAEEPEAATEPSSEALPVGEVPEPPVDGAPVAEAPAAETPAETEEVEPEPATQIASSVNAEETPAEEAPAEVEPAAVPEPEGTPDVDDAAPEAPAAPAEGEQAESDGQEQGG